MNGSDDLDGFRMTELVNTTNQVLLLRLCFCESLSYQQHSHHPESFLVTSTSWLHQFCFDRQSMFLGGCWSLNRNWMKGKSTRKCRLPKLGSCAVSRCLFAQVLAVFTEWREAPNKEGAVHKSCLSQRQMHRTMSRCTLNTTLSAQNTQFQSVVAVRQLAPAREETNSLRLARN